MPDGSDTAVTSGEDRIRLVIDIIVDALPIQGWVSQVDDGWSRPFMGWIDLAGHLEAARGQAEPARRPHPDPTPPEDSTDLPPDRST